MKKLLWFLILLCLLLSPFSCLGQENKSVTVSASVPDEIPPTAPILIAPENGLYLANQTPVFIFKKSTDAQSPVRHYEMYLNGSLFIPEIPSSQTPVQTDQFYCFITNENISISLKKPLSDGLYIWKIRAYDMYGNWIDSAKWTFTIDTQAPFVIINQVGENINLNLSSQDPSSVPSDLKLITYNLQPEFQGRSEPGARIQINLTPVVPVFEVFPTPGVGNSEGKFALRPKEKLKIGEYKVLVIASDAAGNTTTLPEFYLEVKTPVPSPLLPPLPPEILKRPEALLQLPQPVLAVSPLEKTMFCLALMFLIAWLVSAKIGYGFSWKLMPSFLKLFLIPPFFRQEKKCLVFNTINKKGVGFSAIAIFSIFRKTASFRDTQTPEVCKLDDRDGLGEEFKVKEILADIKGKFNLKLDKGRYKIQAKRLGFAISMINLKMEKAGNLAICLKLDPDTKNYRKYLLISSLSVIFLWLAFITAILSLIFWPNIVNLAVFILCLDLVQALL